jgi:hypothetical protein
VVLWLLGFVLVGSGLILRTKPVLVEIHPRRDPSQIYWRGAFSAPSVKDTAFFMMAVANGYQSPPLPLPERIQYRVSMRMSLVVTEEGDHTFELDSPWFGALDIDEQRVFGSGPFHRGTDGDGEIYLLPGVHELRLMVQPSGENGIMRLLWSTPSRKLSPVSSQALTTPNLPTLHKLGAVTSTPLLWMGGCLLGYLLLAWVLRVEKCASKRNTVVAAAVIGLLALATRSANHPYYPRHGGDEYHNSWAGWNLIHEGSPKSWSRLPVYPNKTEIIYFSKRFPIVPAAFDHTPLLQVLVGGTATLLGAQNMYHCTPARTRPLMVLIGALNVILLFLVCGRLVDFQTAFLAGTLMAASPLVVFNSRLTKEENLVQLFWLVGLFLYLKLMKTKDSPRLDYVCGVMLGLAALSKIHGNAIGFAFAAAAVTDKPRNLKRSARILGTSLGVSALYPLYGLILDGQTYLQVVTWLGQRYAIEDAADKFLILPRFILEPNVAAGTHLIDGWILLGWLSLLYLRRQKAISISMVAYLLILMATIHSGNLYGFYIIPLFPFLCLAAAIHIRRVLDGQTILPVFLFVALFFLPYIGRFGDMIPFGVRGLLVLSCLPLVASLARQGGWKTAEILEVFMLRAMLVLGVLCAIHRCLTTL